MPPDPLGPPSDLTTWGKALYRRLRKALETEHRWADTDREILGQTCRYADRARTARAGMVDEGGQPTLTSIGYKGQLVQHPNLKTAESAERAFIDGLKELGFTPAARVRLEIEVAKSSSKSGKFGGMLG